MPSMSKTFGPSDFKTEPRDLNNLTATDAIRLHYFETFNYEAWLRANQEAVRLGIIPRDKKLPEAGVLLKGTPEGKRTAALSVASGPFSYAREFRDNEGIPGISTKDTFKGGIGPFSGFFSQEENPRDQNLRRQQYGAEAAFGPIKFFGRKSTEDRKVVPPKYQKYFQNPDVSKTNREFGAEASWPLGRGKFSSAVTRYLQGEKIPHLKSEFQQVPHGRPEFQDPNRTKFNIGYTRKTPGGNLNISAWLDHIRKEGTGKGLEGFLNLPVGGARLSAAGFWRNPYGGGSDAGGRLGVTIPLGGTR